MRKISCCTPSNEVKIKQIYDGMIRDEKEMTFFQ